MGELNGTGAAAPGAVKLSPYGGTPAQGPLLRGEVAAETPLSVARCLGIIVLGLFPLLGLAACLAWGFGRNTRRQKRNLGRAMLWLHGAALATIIILLAVWVAGLAA
ncbi:MAG: hypothetical protein GXY32_01370 [Ruminococcaceae bacterium]|nr:hypothetical protein [Oscillospiraceae bacterium]